MPVSVPFVSVSYGDGPPEELAHRDAAFRYPSLGPTHAPGITAAGLVIGGPVNVAENFSSFRGRRMQLPLANVPGYDPSAPVVIYSRTSSTSDGAFAVVSIVDSAPAATPMPEVEFARRQGLSRSGGFAADDGGRSHTGWRGVVYGPLTSTLIGGCAEVDVGRALYVLHRRSVGYGAFDWRGATPNPWSGSIDLMMGGNTEQFVNLSGIDVRDMSKLAIDVALNNNSANSVIAALCELVIWQPGAGL